MKQSIPITAEDIKLSEKKLSSWAKKLPTNNVARILQELGIRKVP